MKVARVLICLSLIVLISCSGNGIADPTFLFDGYTGITYTNEIGEIVGPIDPSDWQVSLSSQIGLLSSDSRENQISLSKVIPTKFAINPAYPNPSVSQFKLTIEFPIASSYSITVLDFEGRTIRSISGEADAGAFNILIDLRSEKAGVYRVFYAFSGLSGYGDVWLVNSGSGFFE
ncbi:MAG: hypothetical protein IIB00_03185 [candidate division Zixibacteria bacterium]|nr:hypothetical protein [candidate division Zixibacteria bacterium]